MRQATFGTSFLEIFAMSVWRKDSDRMPEGLGVPELIQEYSAVTRRAFAFNIGPNLKPLFGQEAPPWETLALKTS